MWTTYFLTVIHAENRGKNEDVTPVDNPTFYCGEKCGSFVDLWNYTQYLPKLKLYNYATTDNFYTQQTDIHKNCKHVDIFINKAN